MTQPFAVLLFVFLVTSPTVTSAQIQAGKQQTGKASYYHDHLSGHKTGSGEPYHPEDFTAAHRTLPFNSYVLVTNSHNGRTAVVRINDRGPFKKHRVIDVSKAAAAKLGILRSGLATIKLTPLFKLDGLDISDTLFSPGECRDWHGKKTAAAEGPVVQVWSTDYWKHAFYLASQLVLETGNDHIRICTTGDSTDRTYRIEMSVDSSEAEPLLERLKAEGFFRAMISD